jgi:hypothetical protein
MNKQITLLALKASDPKTGWLDRQKFAQLIVKECIKICSDVEEMDVSDEAFVCMAKIKEHFGVEK